MIHLIEKRIQKLIEELYALRYTDPVPLYTEYMVDHQPIPYDDISSRSYKPLEIGKKWGELWDSSWFRFTGNVPERYKGEQIVALIDIGAEGCLFKDGTPYCGITYKRGEKLFERKRRICLTDHAEENEKVDLLVEGAANSLIGEYTSDKAVWPFFTLNQAELAVFDNDIWQLAMDMDYLLQLYLTLDAQSPRAKRILRGLNTAANLTPATSHIPQMRSITKELIETPAVPSALTAWSVGHAHLDLGWLWPFRETRRKGGRTFSTALRMLEEYPDYVFGASQPQLFAWIKEDYPVLFQEVKQAVASGRFECQGCMWVEPDMNLTSGESLVRQCYYGIKFFQDEFGITINYLWLPDAFGYSAALPQILKKSGVDYFITQKISWNETNTFPHHTFLWYGIDGTPVETHFLPTNDYNATNEPKQMIAAERRFSQSDIQEGFLNLYGIGDGGGGPSRRHIEMARRGKNCEGMPKITMTRASAYLDYLATEGTDDLPSWRGELYLELHRGTYTTQAKMKKYNRKLELELREVELLGALEVNLHHGNYPKEEIETIWKDTLLNQFHDVLPGSSIGKVYEDAHRISIENLKRLNTLKQDFLNRILTVQDEDKITVFNSQPWERNELIPYGDEVVPVTVPSLGFTVLSKQQLDHSVLQDVGSAEVSEDGSVMENEYISVRLRLDGSIASLILKEGEQEMFTQRGGGIFYLFEDKTYEWDAWDIKAYYLETIPEQAKLVERTVLQCSPRIVKIEQRFTVGDSSTITQVLELRTGESLLRATCHVLWKESYKMLRLRAFPNISWPTATYEIQYGNIERPTHSNTSWDKAKFEVCAHRYADLSQPDCGLALLNDCKYGYRIQDGVMDLNLLRSPKNPDPTTDMGEHTFSYAYLPHPHAFAASDVLQQAHNFNSPLTIIEGRVLEDATIFSYFTVDTQQVRIEAVKPAEKTFGIIIRCYETVGGNCKCTVKTPFPITEAYMVNLLEEDAEAREVVNNHALPLTFSPYEIKTLLIR